MPYTPYPHLTPEERSQKTYRCKLRQKVFEQYGKRCNTCGYSDERALQIDHIDAIGSSKRKGSYDSAREALKYPDKFQILCANCNWIKRHTNQEYNGNTQSTRIPPIELTPINQPNYGMVVLHELPQIIEDAIALAIYGPDKK